MAVYELAIPEYLTVARGGSTALAEIRTNAVTAARVTEIGLAQWILTGGNAQAIVWLGRPAARGVPVYEFPMLPLDPADPPSGVTVAVYPWLTEPTAPTQQFRRYQFSGSMAWRQVFQPGIVIPPDSSLILWTNTAANQRGLAVNYITVDQ